MHVHHRFVRGLVALALPAAAVAILPPAQAAGSDQLPPPARALPAVQTQPHSGVRPAICHPEPPDYPGCTREQILPFEKAKWRRIMTGHEPNYRYWHMGQRPKGVLLSTISHALDKHLAKIWWAAYQTARTNAAQRGVPFTSAFHSWAKFRASMSGGCPSALIGLAYPFAWCSAHDSGYTDADWRSALWDTSKAVFGCDGVVISWHLVRQPGEIVEMAAGHLKGGYWEPALQATACTATVLFNRLFGFMKGMPSG